ncbi:Transducin/WD40 repeat-like superfamily protein [Hibiscus syriacus]|uniref:Transducin/WD40 repeat-like superfamily protein n=1 Tax=Hibiscus syriacus TaxID=106335 RepID=A0A6A3BY77_HIBSY|nr:Transducin/WD40 repeat-like superfamily protein [Hibiscus syriacus]
MQLGPQSNFFPDLTITPGTDIIFFCSPNNPTGHAATRKQLQQLVEFARDNGSIIIFDSAYSTYISDDNPKSIFEIPGAKESLKSSCSLVGFLSYMTSTALYMQLLQWSIQYSSGWWPSMRLSRRFSGDAISAVIDYYKENAKILVDTFASINLEVYGGVNAPYVWVRFPGSKSWDVSAETLEKTV